MKLSETWFIDAEGILRITPFYWKVIGIKNEIFSKKYADLIPLIDK